MVRWLKLVSAFCAAVALVLMALANRNVVTLYLMPEDLAVFLNISAAFDAPLFLVLFAGILVGVMVGFFLEWLRAHSVRATALWQKCEVKNLHREMQILRGKDAKRGDDIIALIEATEKK